MKVRVEFFGVVRQRAGVPEVELELPSDATLGVLLEQLTPKFPQLASECFQGAALQEGFIANVGGNRFVRDPEVTLQADTTVLLLAADAGG